MLTKRDSKVLQRSRQVPPSQKQMRRGFACCSNLPRDLCELDRSLQTLPAPIPHGSHELSLDKVAGDLPVWVALCLEWLRRDTYRGGGGQRPSYRAFVLGVRS